jgi:hypothetical protein
MFLFNIQVRKADYDFRFDENRNNIRKGFDYRLQNFYWISFRFSYSYGRNNK